MAHAPVAGTSTFHSTYRPQPRDPPRQSRRSATRQPTRLSSSTTTRPTSPTPRPSSPRSATHHWQASPGRNHRPSHTARCCRSSRSEPPPALTEFLRNRWYSCSPRCSSSPPSKRARETLSPTAGSSESSKQSTDVWPTLPSTNTKADPGDPRDAPLSAPGPSVWYQSGNETSIQPSLALVT